jgi:chromosome partitioning protein
MTEMLSKWTTEWNRPIVIDTHPGLGPISDAAMAASTLVGVPMVLGARELDGLHGFLQLRGGGFPIVLIPNKDRASAQDLRLLKIVEDDVRTFGIRVSPSISDWVWLPRRTSRRAALLLTVNPGKDLARAAEEFRQVAQYLVEVVRDGRTD